MDEAHQAHAVAPGIGVTHMVQRADLCRPTLSPSWLRLSIQFVVSKRLITHGTPGGAQRPGWSATVSR